VGIDSKLQHEFDSHVWLGGAAKWHAYNHDRTDLGQQLTSACEPNVKCVRYRGSCPHCAQFFRLPCDLRRHEIEYHRGLDTLNHEGKYPNTKEISRNCPASESRANRLRMHNEDLWTMYRLGKKKYIGRHVAAATAKDSSNSEQQDQSPEDGSATDILRELDHV